MTDKAMSPLRRRMIEDMTIRKFAPKTQYDYVQRVKNFAAFSRAIAGYGEFRGRAPLPAAFDGERCRRADHQSDHLDSAVLLPRHAQAQRYRRAHPCHSRAAQVAGGAQRRGGGAAARCRAGAQVQGGAERGLWRRSNAPPKSSRSRSPILTASA
jgi:hypothetical protein